jgi:phage major head subunit gpT-like protein
LIVNRQTLLNTTVAFNTIFNEAFGAYKQQLRGRVGMDVPSSTRTNDYRWLGKLKGMREWLGDRQITALEASGYQVVNKDFENTVGVDRNDIADDQIGMYRPMIADLGQTAAEQPDVLLAALLTNAFTAVGFDGQYFVDVDHPVTDVNGVVQNVSNHGGGASTPWFLAVTSRPVKPLIFQDRQSPTFVAKDQLDDDNVFLKKQFLYGVDMRCNAGYGLWQLIFGSKVALDATGYAAARAAMMSMKGDNGRPLNLVPDLLIVPGSLEGAARSLVLLPTVATGGANPWYGTAEVLVSPLL